MWGDVILVSVTGGLIAIDRTAAFQIMVSRPLVAAPLIGLLLGQPVLGAIVGALLELIWINRPPLGGYLPPNECLGSILITAGVILAGRSLGQTPPPLIVLGFLLVVPLARLASVIEKQLRRANGLFAEKAVKAAASGSTRLISGLNLAGLGLTYLSAAVFILAFLPPVTLILRGLYPLLAPSLIQTLDLMYYLLPLVGIAAALSSINVKRSNWAFGLLFFCALALWNL